jgi:gliding motility-associated-like protein
MEPLDYPSLLGDTAICEGDSLVLAVQPNGASVLWSNGSIADSIVVDQTGVYTVSFSQNGCTTADSVAVNTQAILDSLEVGDVFLTCEGTPILVDAFTPNASYLWSNGASTPMATFSESGTYWVQITGICINATDTFFVQTEDCSPLVHVPNSFSPNGDGINDMFQVAWWGELFEIQVLVFDRWGELIFETDDPHGSWDGTYKGSLVQDGVYVYRVLYKGLNADGIVQDELLGHVTIIK